MKRMAAGLAGLGLALATVAPADAEVVTRKDPEPKCSQRPALDVKRATFDYGEKKFVWKVKMGSLTKKRTQVFGRYTVGNRRQDRYDVIVVTLTSHLKGRRANAWAYSVAKGELHGPPCGDYIYSGRMQRG